MIKIQTIDFFSEQVEAAFRDGHAVAEIRAEATNEGRILVTGLTEDQTILAAAMIDQVPIPLVEIARIFGSLIPGVITSRENFGASA